MQQPMENDIGLGVDINMFVSPGADADRDRNSESSSISTPVDKPSKVRKKFAVPPVKVACLECRASRTRCDGKTECTNCVARGKTCVYTQSKRGGSRIRKKKSVSDSSAKSDSPQDNNDLNHCALSVLPEIGQASFSGPLAFVAPGGGLKQLDLSIDDSEFIFDSVFLAPEKSLDSGYETSDAPAPAPEAEQSYSYIRVYSSEQDILSAYYVYIHPYFPILPPPHAHQVTDNPDVGVRRESDAVFRSSSVPDFEPSSPISLAVSASLALIPHPDDPDPFSNESVLLRRGQAQAFAHSAFESIEIEQEMLDSNTQPSEALSSDPQPLDRAPFHPQVPLEVESVIALALLSTYEYAQRGNIAKMRNRAGQALNAAMDLGLHAKSDQDDYFSEAVRRVWWMTYIIVCQGAILSNSTPPIMLFDPRFTTPSPTISADPAAWAVFVESQQMITSATQFVIDLDATLKAKSSTSEIWARMLQLEGMIEPLIIRADSWKLSSVPPLSLDPSEFCVAQALRGIARIKLNSARIKLHRYCAFSDIPIFTKKHCDLRASSPVNNPPMTPVCPCSSTFHQVMSTSVLTTSSLHNSTPPVACGILPYSSHFSAKVCLKSAFNIARSFQSLPYPQPMRASDPMSYFPPMVQNTKSPRMVPIFACCAMQSSYAMIMLSYKTKSMGVGGAPSDGKELPARRMLGQLHEGLQMVLGALKNYSIAYEALGGMRDQLELAAMSVNTMELDSAHMA